MVLSTLGKFRLTILSEKDGIKYEEYTSPDNTTYISVEHGHNFVIKIDALDTDEVFGAKLWLDGEEYPHRKTFKARGHFLGFKLGHGKYRKFVFSKNQYSNIPEETEEDDKSEKNQNESEDLFCSVKVKPQVIDERGLILVRFYKTTKIKSKCIIKKPVNYVKHKIPNLIDNKKMCFQSSVVEEGENIDYGTFQNFKEKVYEKHKDNENYYDDIIDETSILDVVEIKYSDFPALILKGVLSLKNIHHLFMIPSKGIEYALQALETILIYYKYKVTPEQVESLFLRHTKKSFNMYLEGHSIHEFLDMYNHRFLVNESGYIDTISRRESLDNKIKIETGYYVTKKELEFLMLRKKHQNCSNICGYSHIKPYVEKSIKTEKVDLTEVKSECSNDEEKVKFKVIGKCFSKKVNEEYKNDYSKKAPTEFIDLIDDSI